MARFASLRKAPGHVIRILGICKIRHVARHAGRSRQVVVSFVALLAGYGRRCVPQSQQEAGDGVIEFRVQPVVRGVALLARRLERHAAGHVVRVRRALELPHVTGQAVRGHGLELTVRRVLVAGIAIHGSVCAGQREAVVMILDLLDGDVPPAHGVALRAIRTQLALVNIRVAILALVAYIIKYELDVARRAGHAHVHAAQRILGLIVIEFRNGANGPPTLGRMAVGAGDTEAAVRTLRRSGALGLSARMRRGEQDQE